ncbi:MAG: ribulose-phosphate 3-epimerase [Eggerthellaceae bacterium]|jgi:ribulose-phosphate 3-epimerase
MYGSVKIAPSILSANFMEMARDIEMIRAAGADWIHVDVMDGHFVPNLTMGVPFVKDLNAIAPLPVDVHLMIDNPLEELPWFIAAGAASITVHYEAFEDPASGIPEAVGLIHEAGIKAAVSVKPDTPVAVLEPYLRSLDMVLMMSVYPGFSGQSYIPETGRRTSELAQLARTVGADPIIQVDGGIKAQTVSDTAAAGAECFVMGSACFNAADPAASMRAVREEAEATHARVREGR